MRQWFGETSTTLFLKAHGTATNIPFLGRPPSKEDMMAGFITTWKPGNEFFILYTFDFNVKFS